ncbi:MAG: TolC family protein [Solirubrobacteraceae bacterium]
MKKNKTLFLFFLFSVFAFSQVENNTLNVEEYLAIVKKYHPIVKQTNINIQKSEADITLARGGFNPVLNYYLGDKKLNNINYYNYNNPSIKIPTWFGLDISAGIENFSGNRLDESTTVGQVNFIGAKMPLLQNLIIDKRRALLKEAIFFKDLVKTEQKIFVNNILFDAATQYWKWVNAYEAYLILEKNLVISEKRFSLIKKTYLNGERPAIDTLEAKAQFQNIELLRNDFYLKFKNEGLELSNYLWKENNEPYVVKPEIIPFNGWDKPFKSTLLNLNELLTTAKNNHPELEIYNQKLKILEINRKLKFQELLPKLDVEYYHFNKNLNLESNGLFFQNNYQYGLKFEFPLFLSEGRGAYKNSKLKIEENQILQAEKQLAIEVKIKTYFNELELLNKQILLQEDILNSFQKLLKGEETLFMNGESSLFLINTRENKLIETKQKFVDLKIKLLKVFYSLQWSAGTLGL